MSLTPAESRAIGQGIRDSIPVAESWILRHQQGDAEAAGVLVSAYDPLVLFLARSYSRPWLRDWDDCIQEGRLAVLHGCAKYEPGRSTPSSYLGLWIRNRISRFMIDCGQTIRIPNHHYFNHSSRGETQGVRASIWKPRTDFFSDLVIEASTEDEGYEISVEETLLDESEPPFDEQERALTAHNLCAWVLKRVRPHITSVLNRRFCEEPEKLQEIADTLGISRERVRQIEEEGLHRGRELARRNGFEIEPGDTFLDWMIAAQDAIGRGAPTSCRQDEPQTMLGFSP